MSLEVSSDACTGGGSQYYFHIYKFPFLFGYILYLYFGLFRAHEYVYIYINMEEDLSCESA